MSEREALTLSGIALLVALICAVWFERTSWEGAGILGLLFALWAVLLIVKHARQHDEDF